jgi:hypothetical protein
VFSIGQSTKDCYSIDAHLIDWRVTAGRFLFEFSK